MSQRFNFSIASVTFNVSQFVKAVIIDTFLKKWYIIYLKFNMKGDDYIDTG